MINPSITEVGHSYEESLLETYLENPSKKDPLTRKYLTLQLKPIPNKILKLLIKK